MAGITVQRQCWQRWPRVLIAERRNDDGTVDERRYVPEGGTRDQWNGEVREAVRRYDAARAKLDARLHDESELPNLRAEIDGLKWAIEERSELIRDLLAAYFEGIECNLGDCRDCSHRDWPNPCEGWVLFDRAEQAGIEADR